MVHHADVSSLGHAEFLIYRGGTVNVLDRYLARAHQTKCFKIS